MELALRLASALVLSLCLTACGGSGGKLSPSSASREDPNTKTTHSSWVLGQYEPSRNFANRCINPHANNNYQDFVGTYVDENNWIRSWSHETYLWYNELPDIDPATITNTNDYFDRMKTSTTTGNGLPKDRFHYTQNTEEYNQYRETGVSAGYGFTPYAERKQPPRKVIILYSEPNSTAAEEGIGRGAEIISIDGEAVIDGNSDILNAGLKPTKLGELHTFVIKDSNTLSTRTVELRSEETTQTPVHTVKIIQQGNKKIGYILLNSFFIATAEKQLIDSINYLKSSKINELVLDLRYNVGGRVSLSADLGTMIAGESALGSVFTELINNEKLSSKNLRIDFSATSRSNLSVPLGTQLPTLDLQRVYILSSINTASASEYLINGLRGIDFEVILIGTTTLGKPYGWHPTENCGTTYSTIQFKGQNAKGFSDFTYGFVPSSVDNGKDQVSGCIVYDDFTHLLGNRDEKMLATALYHIENDECPMVANDLSGSTKHPLSAVNGEIIRPYPPHLILQ